MAELNDIPAMKALDSVNVLGSIEQFGDQCKEAWDDAGKIIFPDKYHQVTSIVFSGMGGSALGAYVMRSLFFDEIKMPFEIFNGYRLPPYANEKTLAILGSYSGTTEETLSCAQEAVEKKTCLTGLTIGGKLGEILNSAGAPYYKIVPTYNPSNQPRLGTGYSIFGQIAVFNALGILSVSKSEVDLVYFVLKEGNKRYGINVSINENPAKQLALELKDNIPIIVTGEFLGAVGRIMRNQIHETAKNFADYHNIPELNHHLMEGLAHPSSNTQKFFFIFLVSNLYSPRIIKRFAVTREVVLRQGMKVKEFMPTSSTKISQVLECIQFGAYVNYYMAMLYDLDPSKIPWVDFFKTELEK